MSASINTSSVKPFNAEEQKQIASLADNMKALSNTFSKAFTEEARTRQPSRLMAIWKAAFDMRTANEAAAAKRELATGKHLPKVPFTVAEQAQVDALSQDQDALWQFYNEMEKCPDSRKKEIYEAAFAIQGSILPEIAARTKAAKNDLKAAEAALAATVDDAKANSAAGAGAEAAPVAAAAGAGKGAASSASAAKAHEASKPFTAAELKEMERLIADTSMQAFSKAFDHARAQKKAGNPRPMEVWTAALRKKNGTDDGAAAAATQAAPSSASASGQAPVASQWTEQERTEIEKFAGLPSSSFRKKEKHAKQGQNLVLLRLLAAAKELRKERAEAAQAKAAGVAAAHLSPQEETARRMEEVKRLQLMVEPMKAFMKGGLPLKNLLTAAGKAALDGELGNFATDLGQMTDLLTKLK